mmetsp:Transcript_31842/g.74411  ORF Transcript_31842/g.74411 Transcript_31842/m.74411 type:complete len:206 (-) Transcript_31842:784-1401(-)
MRISGLWKGAGKPPSRKLFKSMAGSTPSEASLELNSTCTSRDGSMLRQSCCTLRGSSSSVSTSTTARAVSDACSVLAAISSADVTTCAIGKGAAAKWLSTSSICTTSSKTRSTLECSLSSRCAMCAAQRGTKYCSAVLLCAGSACTTIVLGISASAPTFLESAALSLASGLRAAYTQIVSAGCDLINISAARVFPVFAAPVKPIR